MNNNKTLKILVLLASPRKLGNCEILAKELCRHVPQKHALKLLRLPDKNILPCKACYACLENGNCPQKDDFSLVAREIAVADGVIIASPTYFMGPNGVLKVFLDRCLQMFGHAHSLRGKPAVNIVTAGLEGVAGYTEAALNSFTLILGMKLQASTVFMAPFPVSPCGRSRSSRNGSRVWVKYFLTMIPRLPIPGAALYVAATPCSFWVATGCSARFAAILEPCEPMIMVWF